MPCILTKGDFPDNLANALVYNVNSNVFADKCDNILLSILNKTALPHFTLLVGIFPEHEEKTNETLNSDQPNIILLFICQQTRSIRIIDRLIGYSVKVHNTTVVRPHHTIKLQPL